MKRVLVVVALLAAVQSVSGAVQYEFKQSTHSDLESIPGTIMAGHGVIDGDRSRIDFVSGNAFPPGTYVISSGTRSLTYVDPSKKTYVEVNAAGVATAIGSARITITNKKVNLTQLDDHPVIAGFPTDHWRLTIDYNITLAVGTMPMTQSVHETIDKWVTKAFGSVAETFLATGEVRTGNPDLDDLIATENNQIKGFALRQTTNVTTMNANQQVFGSQLKLSRSLTQTRELTVTSIIETTNIPADLFVVPASYKKPDPLRDDTQKAPLQILSMQPASGK